MLLAILISAAFALSLESTNDVCAYNVSKTLPDAIKTIADALASECADPKIYDITLLDSEHIEQLSINQNVTVFIKGGNGSATVWKAETPEQQILFIDDGNITLENLEFQFIITNETEIHLSPTNNLIFVEGMINKPSITLISCIFQSIDGDFKDKIYQLHIHEAQLVQIINSTFNGLGSQNKSCVSIVSIDDSVEVTIKGCLFQNALFSENQEAVIVMMNTFNTTLVIQNNSFINITLSQITQEAALSIYSFVAHKEIIAGNTFTNLYADKSSSAALFIRDSTQDQSSLKYQFINNTFTNNTGKVAGAVYLYSTTPSLHYDFTYNTFKLNKNNVTDGLGKDAYFNFTEPHLDWTVDIIKVALKDMFNGSKSDAKKGSVYFETYNDTGVALSGSVTLSKAKWYQNVYVIIGIACGAIVLIVITVLVFICCVVGCRKWKKAFNSTGDERKPLISNKQSNSA